MSEQERIQECLRKEIRSLLISTKDGLTPQQLEKEYLLMVGNHLPLRILGYRSTMELVLDMPDVVRVCPCGDGTVILKGRFKTWRSMNFVNNNHLVKNCSSSASILHPRQGILLLWGRREIIGTLEVVDRVRALAQPRNLPQNTVHSQKLHCACDLILLHLKSGET